MHHLIQSTYVITKDASPEWDGEERALQDLLAVLTSALDSVAIQDPLEQRGDQP